MYQISDVKLRHFCKIRQDIFENFECPIRKQELGKEKPRLTKTEVIDSVVVTFHTRIQSKLQIEIIEFSTYGQNITKPFGFTRENS